MAIFFTNILSFSLCTATSFVWEYVCVGVVLLIQPLAFVHTLYYDYFEQIEEEKFNVISCDSVLWLFSVYFFTKICYRIIGFVPLFLIILGANCRLIVYLKSVYFVKIEKKIAKNIVDKNKI